jgi:hypothetical protein
MEVLANSLSYTVCGFEGGDAQRAAKNMNSSLVLK